MSEVQTKVKGRVRLFACGGGGINIGSEFEKHRGSAEPGFAEIDVTYIDTSRSNLRASIPPEHCYLIDGLDGSGKVRSENYEEISSRIRDILQQHKPADLNIVVSTAAGGSGSVIAPSLASELISRDIPTIVIAVGSADTRLDAENTLKTLKSYEAVSKLRKASIVLFYVQNSDTMSRTEADKRVHVAITSLCGLFSRQNKELDTRDLFNWLRFERVTTFPAQLAALTLIENVKDLSALSNVISVATLTTPETGSKLPVMPEYQCTGFFPEEAGKNKLSKAPLHFVTSDGLLNDVANELQITLKALEEQQQARIKRTGILSSHDAVTESGLVL